MKRNVIEIVLKELMDVSLVKKNVFGCVWHGYDVKLKLEAVWRIRDVYPGSRILIFTPPGSRIPEPKTATKEKGEKNLM